MLKSSNILSLLKRQKESGLSIKSFCSNEGIAPSTFYYWKKKINKDTPGQRFIPLVVQSHSLAGYTSSNGADGPGTETSPLEIIYSNGTTLRIRQTLDLSGLRSLVCLLD
jgi:hypothetical protein